MSEYCKNKELREWNLGHDVPCNGKPEKCSYLVKFGKQEYCGWCPPRVALHQVIRGQAQCIFCEYATKKLSYPRCVECLGAPERINFKREVI